MGSQISQVSPSTQPQGKSATQQMPQFAQPSNQPSDARGKLISQSQGKSGQATYPSQSGQPQMGQPNNYPNTVGQWDNASIQPQQSQFSGGKGKG